jgi:hypothetical protein
VTTWVLVSWICAVVHITPIMLLSLALVFWCFFCFWVLALLLSFIFFFYLNIWLENKSKLLLWVGAKNIPKNLQKCGVGKVVKD